MADQEFYPYLVISGGDVPAVVVGPFPKGFAALFDFDLPAGYDTATSHSTRDEAEKEAEWYRANQPR